MLPLAGAAMVAPQGRTTGRQQRRCPRGKQRRILLGAAFLLGEPPDATADSDFYVDGTLE
jgi:hypothetical protein